MDAKLQQAIENLIEEQTGAAAHVAGGAHAGGGCINDAQVIELTDGRRFFLKSNPQPLPKMFAREAEGLRALGQPGVIRVPSVIGYGGADRGTIRQQEK